MLRFFSIFKKDDQGFFRLLYYYMHNEEKPVVFVYIIQTDHKSSKNVYQYII